MWGAQSRCCFRPRIVRWRDGERPRKPFDCLSYWSKAGARVAPDVASAKGGSVGGPPFIAGAPPAPRL